MVTNGTTGALLTMLKSQFFSAPRRPTLVGPDESGAATAVSTANVIAEKFTKVIAAADIPNRVSVRTGPTTFAYLIDSPIEQVLTGFAKGLRFVPDLAG
jgi:hypothetical protein